MTVITAARDTATRFTSPTTPYADGTTRAATLDATLSHAVLMLQGARHEPLICLNNREGVQKTKKLEYLSVCSRIW